MSKVVVTRRLCVTLEKAWAVEGLQGLDLSKNTVRDEENMSRIRSKLQTSQKNNTHSTYLFAAIAISRPTSQLLLPLPLMASSSSPAHWPSRRQPQREVVSRRCNPCQLLSGPTSSLYIASAVAALSTPLYTVTIQRASRQLRCHRLSKTTIRRTPWLLLSRPPAPSVLPFDVALLLLSHQHSCQQPQRYRRANYYLSYSLATALSHVPPASSAPPSAVALRLLRTVVIPPFR